MLRDESFQGYWFLPGADEAAHVSGVLNVSAVSGLELSLNGILDERDLMGGNHRVIFGVTSSGKEVTLARCLTTHGNP